MRSKHSAMIFQNYNLFANKNVLHNVMEPLVSAKRIPKDIRDIEDINIINDIKSEIIKTFNNSKVK